MNTGRGHLPLETNGPGSFLCSVGLATQPPQQACYLPSIPGTHLYTWVERSTYSKVPYSRTQYVNFGNFGACFVFVFWCLICFCACMTYMCVT